MSFTAATWNVFHGTHPERLERTLRRLLHDDVSLFLLQEMQRRDVRELFRDHGLRLAFTRPQYAIAWNPAAWVGVLEDDVTLSEHTFWTKSGHPMVSRAARAILSDRSGRTVTALSYHTPASVQVANPPDHRMIVLRDSMETLSELADHAKTHAVLFGGDDNVDEQRTFRDRWSFMRFGATGLRQVRAPRGTHGRRRIDDFRTRGLRAGGGWTVENPSDHDVHVRRFRWSS